MKGIRGVGGVSGDGAEMGGGPGGQEWGYELGGYEEDLDRTLSKEGGVCDWG